MALLRKIKNVFLSATDGIRKFWRLLEITPLPVILILIGALLYFYAYANLRGSPFERLVHDVAISCVILGAFSLLMELGHIKQYISRRLGDVVMKREYLQMLNLQQLDAVKRDVDSILYGRGALIEGNLFRFMDDLRAKYIGTHFRENSRDFLTLEDDDEIPNVMTVDRVLTYFLVKGDPAPEKPTSESQVKKNLPEPMLVGSRWGVDVIAGLGNEARNYLLKLKVTIKGPKTFDEFCLSEEQGGALQLSPTVASDNRKAVAVVTSLSDDGADIRWFFEYKPDWVLALEAGERIEVTMEEKIRIPKRDILYISAREPTKSMTVVFKAPREFTCHAATFGLVSGQSRVLRQGGEEVIIVFDDWILPGHGWAVIWFPPET